MQKFLQKYLLLIAMTIGILLYKPLSHLTPIIPYFLSGMLFITYCRVRWMDIRLTKFHYILLIIQYVGSAVIYLAIRPFNEIVAQAAMICVLNATATAAPVITGILGGNIASVAAYAVVSNLLLAFMAPVYLSWIGNTGTEIPFFASFWFIFQRVMPILIAPFVLAFLLSKTWKKAHDAVKSAQIVSFYLWAIALTVVVATVAKSAVENNSGDYRLFAIIGTVSFLICFAQFFFGRKLGARFGQTVAGGQNLGQKNGVLAIWLTQTYLNPAASLGPGLYVLWQNLANSYQIWQRKRFEERAPHPPSRGAIVSVRNIETDTNNIQLVADTLRNGNLAAIPTETVYGIAANALDEKAVARIFSVKGRPQDNPLIVHIADIEDWDRLVTAVTPEARKLAEAFFPGPLTIILPSSGLVPKSVNAGLDTVAVRMPGLAITREIIRRAGVPIAAPSANISGRPSPTTAQHCVDDLWGKVELIADGGDCEVGLESTVITLATDTPRILRPGAITAQQISEVIGCEVEIDASVFAQINKDTKVSSPGMKYKHYSPKAPVTLLDGDTEQVMRYLSEQKEEGVWALVFDEDMPFLPISGISLGKSDDASEQAFRLFAALRALDEKDAKHIYARVPDKEGVGLAVYNRMIRAAGFRIISSLNPSQGQGC